MNKKMNVVVALLLSFMLLVPAAASAASTAKSGLYNIETSEYVSIKQFKLLNSKGKGALLLNANVYLVLTGTVYPAKAIIEAPTNKALKEASQTEAAFEAEKEIDLTSDGKIVEAPPVAVEEEFKVLSIE